ncbi:MAG: DinB family protein [Thermomicrobiales bacterium]
MPDGDVLALLTEQIGVLDDLLRGLSGQQAEFRFAPGEWRIREVVGHLIDAERLFAYRAFTISDETAIMPGIGPDVYVREGTTAPTALELLKRADFPAARECDRLPPPDARGEPAARRGERQHLQRALARLHSRRAHQLPPGRSAGKVSAGADE